MYNFFSVSSIKTNETYESVLSVLLYNIIHCHIKVEAVLQHFGIFYADHKTMFTVDWSGLPTINETVFVNIRLKIYFTNKREIVVLENPVKIVIGNAMW